MNSAITRKTLKILSWLAAAFLAVKTGYMAANVISFSLAANIPNEVRDLVQYRVVWSFMAGQNPYAYEALSSGTVPLAYMYTFLQPLCTAVVCKLTGVGVIAGNFVVNVLCILGTAMCIWILVKDVLSVSGGRGAGFIALLLTAGTSFAMFNVPFFTFRPDALGILLSTFLFLLLYKSPQRVILSAFLTIMLIHTKQILVVMALPVFLWYLLNDAKLAWRYFAACVIFTAVEIAAIMVFFPLYWGEAVYSLFTTIYGFKLWTAFRNICIFCRRYVAFIALGLAGIVLMLSRREGSLFSRVAALLSDLRHEYIMLILLNMVCSLAFLTYFARNGGDGIKYCSDMLASSVIIFAVLIWKHAVPSWTELRRSLMTFMVCCAALCSFMLGGFYYHKFSLQDICNYAEAWQTISQYDNGTPMYLGMTASNYLADSANTGKEYIYFDDGHIEYQNKELSGKKFAALTGRLLHVDKIYEAGRNYAAKVNQMVKDKKFCLIVQGLGRVISKEALTENYRELKTLELAAVTGERDVTFYVPR